MHLLLRVFASLREIIFRAKPRSGQELVETSLS
jgi:hypothetical protein